MGLDSKCVNIAFFVCIGCDLRSNEIYDSMMMLASQGHAMRRDSDFSIAESITAVELVGSKRASGVYGFGKNPNTSTEPLSALEEVSCPSDGSLGSPNQENWQPYATIAEGSVMVRFHCGGNQ